MRKAVYGLVATEEHARRIVDRLLDSDFSNEDISIISPGRGHRRTDVDNDEIKTHKNVKKGMTTEKKSKAPEGGVAGATAGGLLGGSLGLLAGIGAIAIPGLGPFIAAGPLMAALSGSAVGGSLGLLLGSLVGAGIPEYEAKKFEVALRSGNTLISVHAANDEEIETARDIMKKEGAKDIATSKEKAKSR